MSATTFAPATPVPDRAGREGYTVQQVARSTGLSEHTLRYYERARLLDRRMTCHLQTTSTP